MSSRIIFFIVFSAISTSTLSEELMSWQELDAQDSTVTKLIYSNNFDEAKEMLESKVNLDDPIYLYNLGMIYSRYNLYEYCSNCGHCPGCVDSINLGKEVEFDFEITKSKKNFRKSMRKGHPYAGFAWARADIVSFKNEIPGRELKLTFQKLEPYVQKNDSVAHFMKNYLNTDLLISEETPIEIKQRRKQLIDETISLLESEAKEGRILSMYYLAITYRLQHDFIKSFTWFYIAKKHGHWLSGQYLGDTFSKFKTKSKQQEAMQYLVEMSRIFNITLD